MGTIRITGYEVGIIRGLVHSNSDKDQGTFYLASRKMVSSIHRVRQYNVDLWEAPTKQRRYDLGQTGSHVNPVINSQQFLVSTFIAIIV